MADPGAGGRGRGRGRGGGRGQGRGGGAAAGGGASASVLGVAAAPSLFVRKGSFAKELASMLYGFGDGPNAQADTVALVEDVLCDYIIGMAS